MRFKFVVRERQGWMNSEPLVCKQCVPQIRHSGPLWLHKAQPRMMSLVGRGWDWTDMDPSAQVQDTYHSSKKPHLNITHNTHTLHSNMHGHTSTAHAGSYTKAR
jgi:hypothetical protein